LTPVGSWGRLSKKDLDQVFYMEELATPETLTMHLDEAIEVAAKLDRFNYTITNLLRESLCIYGQFIKQFGMTLIVIGIARREAYVPLNIAIP
jgi:hypothetical protein